MAFLDQDGFRLYYEDTGSNAPTVLFLHGAGGNHLSWWQQVPVFAEEYRCITVDQRGFGQSPDVTAGPGPAALATDALALLDHLGIARAAVVAQSMGGWAAVGAAVRAPQRFWAIALANTVGNLTNPEVAAVKQRLAAASPPRPAVLWHAALGPTFRRAHPVQSFLYGQIAGVNPPRPADFSEQLRFNPFIPSVRNKAAFSGSAVLSKSAESFRCSVKAVIDLACIVSRGTSGGPPQRNLPRPSAFNAYERHFFGYRRRT